MFELSDEEGQFQWPVKVLRPDKKNPGKKTEAKFEVTFKELPVDELKAFTEKTKASEGKIGDIEFCKEVVTGFKDVILSGEEVEFSEANLNKLLTKPGVARSVADAYLEATNGVKIKN